MFNFVLMHLADAREASGALRDLSFTAAVSQMIYELTEGLKPSIKLKDLGKAFKKAGGYDEELEAGIDGLVRREILERGKTDLKILKPDYLQID